MSQGNLYRDNLAATMHETRRTHWLVWVFMWAMLLGCVLGIYGMTCEALAESQRRDVIYGDAR